MNATTTELHRELDTPRRVTAQVDLVSGSVAVTASGSGRADVRIRPAHAGDAEADAYVAEARVELDDDRLRVLLPHAKPLRRRHPEVRIELLVPIGSDLEVRTAAVSLTTDGPLGDVSVKGASGTLIIDSATGDVDIRTAAGDVEVGEVGGHVTVKSGSSRVQVGRADGGLTVTGAAGDVHAVRVTGDVRVQTAAGNVRIDALGAGRTRVDAKMSNVDIGVIAGLDVKLDLHSALGVVDCELDRMDSPAAPSSTGALDLHASTATGRVRVFASEL
jgi:hypothetical protein